MSPVTMLSTKVRNADRAMGAILVDAGRVSPAEVDRILQYQQQTGVRFGEAGKTESPPNGRGRYDLRHEGATKGRRRAERGEARRRRFSPDRLGLPWASAEWRAPPVASFVARGE